MELKKFIRDKRSPVPKDANVSKVMSANKAKNTKPEILIRRELYRRGLVGYRLHNKKIPGRPDISFNRQKLAIFIHGCYWHRCTHCDLPLPKTNTEFWKQKFNANVARDKKKNDQLKDLDWKVVTIWECKLKKDLSGQIANIEGLLN